MSLHFLSVERERERERETERGRERERERTLCNCVRLKDCLRDDRSSFPSQGRSRGSREQDGFAVQV